MRNPFSSAGLRSIALAAALFLILATHLVAQESGAVEGRVANGTTGGEVAGLEVNLAHFSMEPMPPRTTTTDEEGYFRFDGLPMGPQHGYVVSVEYAGVAYESELWRATQGETQHSLELTVYETTASTAALRISRAHHVVLLEADALAVLELLVIANWGDRTVVPLGGAIAVPLPQGATELQLTEEQEEGRAVLEAGALSLRISIPPGETELIYTYRLPAPGPSLRWVQFIVYPIDFYDVLLPTGSARVSSSGLSYQGTRQIEEGSYDYWSGQGLVAGDALTIDFAALPSGAQSPPVGETSVDVQAMARWAGIALAALGVGLAFWYPRSRRGPASQEEP